MVNRLTILKDKIKAVIDEAQWAGDQIHQDFRFVDRLIHLSNNGVDSLTGREMKQCNKLWSIYNK